MKDFREQLMQDLLNHASGSMDITYLLEKYCGQKKSFEPNDHSQSTCRGEMNVILRDLQDNMKWITFYPTSGFSMAHHNNPNLNQREFIMDIPVKVRLTTTGEIEYKKINEEVKAGHIVTISGNNNAPILLGGDKSTQTSTFAPHLPNETPTAKAGKTSKIIVSVLKWIWDNIWKIAVAVISGYILFKLGLKK